jgi:hypothetical protein
MSKPQIRKLGNLTRDDIKFPEHLTPEVVHIALFIHNADCKEETIKRVEHGIKTVGEKTMAYVMAILVLPWLMDKTQDTTDYKDFIASKKKTIN